MRELGWLLVAMVGVFSIGIAPGLGEDADAPVPNAAPDPASAGPAKPPIITLREAVKSSTIEAKGFDPKSYQRVHLKLSNRGDEPVRIDVCGSYLMPRTGGSCQRLGLGPVVTPRSRRTPRRVRPKPEARAKGKGPRTTPSGTVVVSLKPGESKTLELNTCCLDSGKPAPRDQTFVVARSPLPKVREKVLRWWADNPETPQGAVNSAIWQNRDEVRLSSGTFVRAERPMPKRVAAHGGSAYVVRDNGELMSVDRDGIQRFLGTEIVDVFPTSAAVYAVAPGRQLASGNSEPRELWRLVLTGDKPWKKVAEIPNDLTLRDLQVSPGGSIYVTTNRGLYTVDTATLRFDSLVITEDPDHLSLQFGEKGKVLVTRRRPAKKGYYQGGELRGTSMAGCDLYELTEATGKLDLVKTFWNVRQIKAGPMGVYALTPAGKLRFLVGKSLRNAPGHIGYRNILAVGRTRVWLEDKHHRLVAADKTGRYRFDVVPLTTLSDWGLDRYTDEVLFIRSHAVRRVEPKKGRSGRAFPHQPGAPILWGDD